MSFTVLFLKQDTHCIEKNAYNSALIKKNYIFYKENTLFNKITSEFSFSSVVLCIQKKIVNTIFHCIIMYTLYTMYCIQCIYKTTVSNKYFYEVKF